MKKRSSKRVLNEWLKFTAAVLILFFIDIVAVFTAFAEDKGFSVLDMMGRPVYQNEDGEYLASSDIAFEFKGVRPPETEDMKERDWIFCECEEIDGRDIYTPVKGGCFRLDLRGDMQVSFLWIDRISGDTMKEDELPESFIIRVRNLEDMGCKTEFSYGEKGADGFLSGDEPKLMIDPPEGICTFLSVKNGREEEVYELKEAHNEFSFKEGEYSLEAWSEDGWGIKTEQELPVDHFIYDASAPVMGNINVRPSDRNVNTFDGKIFTSKSVIITPFAEDGISGVDHFIFRIKNKVDQSEYEAYGDEIQLNPGFRGSVVIRAKDMAGNLSEERRSPELVIDDRQPGLRERVIEEEKKGTGKIRIRLAAEDDLSGIERLTLYLNGEKTEEETFDGKLKGVMEREISLEDLRIGKNEFLLEAEDMTGNLGKYEFSLEKEDRKKEHSEKNRDNSDEEGKKEEEPELYLTGFRNFEKREDNVCIKAGVKNDIVDEGKVIIERHGAAGELLEAFEEEPGSITLSDEGNYAVRYEVEKNGNVYEKNGYFTIDRSSPVIKSLKGIDKKTFRSFALEGDPFGYIEDLTYVNARITLSGREYDGREISEPGKYVLKISASDELGHKSQESAEFIIENVDASKNGENGLRSTLQKSTLSGNILQKGTLSEKDAERAGLSGNDMPKATLSGSAAKKGTLSEKDAERAGLSGNDTPKATLSGDITTKTELSGNGEGIYEKTGNNLASPGTDAEEKTVYKNEMTIIPIIIMCGILLCVAGTVILIVYPAMERNWY